MARQRTERLYYRPLPAPLDCPASLPATGGEVRPRGCRYVRGGGEGLWCGEILCGEVGMTVWKERPER